jgi:hypothetical protein
MIFIKYFLIYVLIIVTYSCIPVYESYDYVHVGTTDKWDSIKGIDERSSQHLFKFIDSNDKSNREKGNFLAPYLEFSWIGRDERIYTTFLFIPIFPDFLFNKTNSIPKKSNALINLKSENNSLIFDLKRLKRIKMFVNNGCEIHPFESITYLSFIDTAGFRTYVVPETIENDSVEIFRQYGHGIHTFLNRNEFEKIKYYESIDYQTEYFLDSDTIKTLTIVFDTLDINGSKVYIEPLRLEQRTFRYYDYSIFVH